MPSLESKAVRIAQLLRDAGMDASSLSSPKDLDDAIALAELQQVKKADQAIERAEKEKARLSSAKYDLAAQRGLYSMDISDDEAEDYLRQFER